MMRPAGTIEYTKSGETFFDASKQLESLEEVTSTPTLVPPEPKPVLSLTWSPV